MEGEFQMKKPGYPMIDAIYVIYHREDVRLRIEKGLSELDNDVPIKYIKGPNGNDPHFSKWLLDNDYRPMPNWKLGLDPNPEGYAFRDWHKRDHKYGEIACAIGHLSAWKQAKKDGAKWPLFLEQDAIPNTIYTWKEAYAKTEYYLTQLNNRSMDWNILYAGQADACESDPIVNPHFKIQKTHWTYCLHSYILTRKALDEILSHDFEHHLCVPDDYIPAFYSEGHHAIHPNLRHLGGRLRAYNMETMPFIQEQGTEIGSHKLHSDTENSPYISDSFFIEIGTSDFDTLEPLAQQGWKGIFVEPIGELLSKIKRFEGCYYEESAILDYNGTTDIQYYDLDWAKQWQRGVGSTSDINNFNANPQFKKHVKKRAVNVMTLDRLIDKYDVKNIDYLKIDIEGMEWAILQDYTWEIKPKKIKCEYAHWPSHGIELGKYVEMLEFMNYKVTILEEDFIAEL
jgi:FkbM family methyltransferase